MIIGLDLDNTIVNCDALFQQEAEARLEVRLTGKTREQIRSMVRETLGDSQWTAIQAEVYGPRYLSCPPCDGAVETIRALTSHPKLLALHIISHKTKTDSAGKQYKLREAAFAWIEHNLIAQTPLTAKQVTFCDTLDDKLQTISSKGCSIFFDDLKEVILPLQSKVLHPILFSPHPTAHPLRDTLHVCDWPSFRTFAQHA